MNAVTSAWEMFKGGVALCYILVFWPWVREALAREGPLLQWRS